MTDVRMPDNQKIRLCMGCMKQYDSRYDVCPYCGYFVQTSRRDASILEPGTILHGRYIAGEGSRHYDNSLHGMFEDGHTALYIGWDCVEEKRGAIEEYFPANLAERTREGKLSLKEYFTTRRPMWEDQVLNLTLGIATALNRVHQMRIGLFEIRSLYHIRVLDPDNRDYPDVELYDFYDYVQGVYGDWFLYWHSDHADSECDLFQKQERDICELIRYLSPAMRPNICKNPL